MLIGLGTKRRMLQKQLEAAGLERAEAAAESRLMLCHLTGAPASDLPADVPVFLEEKQEKQLNAWTEGRKKGIPLAYLLGETEFYGRCFLVGDGVLIPRQDTEILVEEALSFLAGRPAALSLSPGNPLPLVWDLCAGSGCVGLTLAAEAPLTHIHLLEKEEKAFGWLQKNGAAFALENASVHQGDVFTFPLPEQESVDLIVSNPPYIPNKELAGLQKEVQQEPSSALDGGEDGLIFYRLLTERWAGCLKKGGGLFVEIGFDQGKAVADLFAANGFSQVAVTKDLGGRDRVVSGIRM